MACSAKLDITFHMTINILFYIFVSHDISYGCQIWGQSRSTYINKIIKLQNRALRITNFATYDADSNPLAIYLSNKILKLEDIIKLQNCLLVYDYMNNTLPSCFQNYYFRQNHMNYDTQTRNSTLGCLFVPSKRTSNYGLKSISQQAIYNWNKITQTKKIDLLTQSRTGLKSKITKHYIENYQT